MNYRYEASGIDYFHKRITIIFVFLVIAMAALMTFYWAFVLEPQLVSRAKITARSVVKANIYRLSEILENVDNDHIDQQINEIRNIFGHILLLEDSESGAVYISGITMEVDYDALNLKSSSLDMNIGGGETATSVISEIPVYSQINKELLGIIRCVVGKKYISIYLNRIKISFYSGAGIGLLLLLSAWALVAVLMVKVRSAESQVMEKQTQLIHAGRLTAMGEMATGIAHELNQPLAIIRLASDGLKNFFGDIKSGVSMEKTATEKISLQVERAAGIIDNMRSFARIGSDKLEIEDVRIPVLKAISFFREQFRINEIVLEENISESEQKVMINPQRFEQVVVNLLTNARYALGEKERLTNSSFKKKVVVNLHQKQAKHKNQIIFEVIDNGTGMTDSEKERCLEPFYTTREVGEGTGLGLSIVHTILKEQNMVIEIESEKGKGSSFRIIIA